MNCLEKETAKNIAFAHTTKQNSEMTMENGAFAAVSSTKTKMNITVVAARV
jgi:hypothetical protein